MEVPLRTTSLRPAAARGATARGRSTSPAGGSLLPLAIAASDNVLRIFRSESRRRGLSTRQAMMLVALSRGPRPASALAVMLHAPQGALHPTIASLTARSLTRASDEGSGEICLSRDGATLLAELNRATSDRLRFALAAGNRRSEGGADVVPAFWTIVATIGAPAGAAAGAAARRPPRQRQP
jgi:hypothetical protein